MKPTAHPTIALIGFGNCGRSDDGLGPGLARRMLPYSPEILRVEIVHQLMPEHAELVAAHDTIIFADAAVATPPPFLFKTIVAAKRPALSSHSFPPESLLSAARDFFGKTPAAFLLGIRGYNFEMGERLSAAAAENLTAAERFLKNFLETNTSLLSDGA
jgi:hydrogenase maturation protease